MESFLVCMSPLAAGADANTHQHGQQLDCLPALLHWEIPARLLGPTLFCHLSSSDWFFLPAQGTPKCPCHSCCTAFCARAWPAVFPGVQAMVPRAELKSSKGQSSPRSHWTVPCVSLKEQLFPLMMSAPMISTLLMFNRAPEHCWCDLVVEHLKIWSYITHTQPQSCVSKYITINRRTRNEWSLITSLTSLTFERFLPSPIFLSMKFLCKAETALNVLLGFLALLTTVQMCHLQPANIPVLSLSLPFGRAAECSTVHHLHIHAHYVSWESEIILGNICPSNGSSVSEKMKKIPQIMHLPMPVIRLVNLKLSIYG